MPWVCIMAWSRSDFRTLTINTIGISTGYTQEAIFESDRNVKSYKNIFIIDKLFDVWYEYNV